MITRRSFTDAPATGYWHDTIIDELVSRIPSWADVNLLITPGSFRDAGDINTWLKINGPAIVWILGDEEGDCPFWEVKAPVWKQFPNPHRPFWPDRCLPLGYTPHTRPTLRKLGLPLEKAGWVLSGQKTNRRRKDAFNSLQILDPNKIFPSLEFAGGVDPETFITQLWEAGWAPAPSGNVRVDSFRMWEALEAGAVPILDSTTPHKDRNTWPEVIGDHPFPVVGHWAEAGPILKQPPPYVAAGVWYTPYKRDLVHRLVDDWYALIEKEPWPEPEDRISVIVTASPLPSHPGFEILTETVESIRERLPGREICIAFDGPREPSADYDEHIRRVAWWANQYWPEVWLWYSGHWKHQAGTVKDVLPHMRTGALLMVEADTPLRGDLPWRELVTALYTEDLNMIRFHYDTEIHPEHKYLMRGAIKAHGLDFIRTMQYSQRPHLTTTWFYADLLADLSDEARTYIEDWKYGAVETSPWDHHKIGIYKPAGDMQRSYHLDGRAGTEKGEFWS